LALYGAWVLDRAGYQDPAKTNPYAPAFLFQPGADWNATNITQLVIDPRDMRVTGVTWQP
jgi:hypothetical protein